MEVCGLREEQLNVRSSIIKHYKFAKELPLCSYLRSKSRHTKMNKSNELNKTE